MDKEAMISQWYGFDFFELQDPVDFNEFFKHLWGLVVEELGENYAVKAERGHFRVSMTVFNKKTGKYVFLHFPDVRYFQNEWLTNIMVWRDRSAKHFAYLVGDENDQTWQLKELVERLTK